MTTLIFRCAICQKPVGNPHLCLDRRVEKLAVVRHDGKPVTSIKIANRLTMFMYCSQGCWHEHQTDVTVSLKLQQTFPAFSFVTPCCRCGKAVNRTQHYVNYSISEMRLEGEDVLIGHCIDDHDFAVLCKDCENPDFPESVAEPVATVASEEAIV